MPPSPGDGPAPHRLVRMVTCVRGAMTFDATVAPRFDYGRRKHDVRLTDAGAVFEAGDDALTLHAVRERDDERLAQVRNEDGDLHAELPLSAGQTRGIVLEWGARTPREFTPAEIAQDHAETAAFWRSWLSGSTYHGRWREMVQRSAITLKLMTYAPTGGLVAAPTAALPEQVGGERNWDYRYTWVRDASFSVRALLGLGFVEEAATFAGWLRDRVAERAGEGDGPPLDIMYRVDGASDLVEESLDHWAGYRGSRPGADRQRRRGAAPARHLRRGARQHLRRGPRRDRGRAPRLDGHLRHPRLAGRQLGPARGGHLGDPRRPAGLHLRAGHVAGSPSTVASGWPSSTAAPRPSSGGRAPGTRSTRRSSTRGGTPTARAFVQHYATDVLDSSLLRAAGLGLMAPHDPMWLSTLDAMRRRARHRQPGLPLRPGRLARRPAGVGGNLLAVHVQLGGRPGPLGPARRGPADLREDAHVRQPRRAVLRGDRAHRRADRQLPAGVHPPRAHRLGADPRRRPGRRPAAGPRPGSRQARRRSTYPPWRRLGGRPRRFRWPAAGRNERGGARPGAGSSPSSLAPSPPPEEASLQRDEESPGRPHQCGGWKGELVPTLIAIGFPDETGAAALLGASSRSSRRRRRVPSC